MTRTEKLIFDDEGYREFVYTDTTGHRTIGIGLNLDAGLPMDEAELLMSYRVKKIREELAYRISAFNALSSPRQDVLISMAYNLGIPGLMKFRKMLSAVNEGNFKRAAMEMKNSLWADQVPRRSKRLAQMMEKG